MDSERKHNISIMYVTINILSLSVLPVLYLLFWCRGRVPGLYWF